MNSSSKELNAKASSIDSISNSLTIESMFSTSILLDVFLSPELISEAKNVHYHMANRRCKEGLIQGYKLLLITTLDEYIENIIRYPEFIGVEPDLDYRDYWVFTKGRGREVTKGSVRTGHIISKYISKAACYIEKILACKTWESIEELSNETKDFRVCLRQISEKAYTATKGGKPVLILEALTEAAMNILWHACGNYNYLAHRYADYFISRGNNPTNTQLLNEMTRECFISHGLTRFDSSFTVDFNSARPIPSHWAFGYGYFFHETLKMLATSENKKALFASMDNIVLNIKTWKDVKKYDDILTARFGLPKIFRGYKYSKLHQITDEDRLPLLLHVESKPSPERLLSIFGNRARIVERGFPGACNSFECLLDGAIKRSKRTKEKVKVAIFIHQGHKQKEDYSVGIFMPAYGSGLISTNGSMWWVFYLIGNNHSGTASHQWRMVASKIKRNIRHVDLITEYASEEEFYRYCEDPGYLRINNAVALTNKITSEVRGVFPELLLSNMLINQGCSKVLNRIRPKVIKSVKGELDTVGLKLTDNKVIKVTIFESKGQATNDQELQEEINRFSANVRMLQENLRLFCDELNVLYCPSVEFKAIFVSMDTLKLEQDKLADNDDDCPFDKVIIDTPSNIMIWDFERFVSELKKAGVSRTYLDLLKKTPLAIVINLNKTNKHMAGMLGSFEKSIK